MSIGMTYEEYWYATPYLVKTYYQCHKYKVEQRNQELWLHGVYVQKALQNVVSSAFSKSGKDVVEYPEEPFRLFPMTEAEKKAEEEKERAKAIASFGRLQGMLTDKFSTTENT